MSEDQDTSPAPYSPFWPLVILSGTLIVFLGWQVMQAAKVYTSLRQTMDQQDLLSAQAAQTESQLQSMMMQLLKIAESDPAAKAIAEKYQIKYTPPPTQTPPASILMSPPQVINMETQAIALPPAAQ